MNRADDAAMYHPPETVYSDCGEGQKMADTYKACQPFLPLSATVLFGNFPPQNVLTEPLKKPVLDWADSRLRITA